MGLRRAAAALAVLVLAGCGSQPAATHPSRQAVVIFDSEPSGSTGPVYNSSGPTGYVGPGYSGSSGYSGYSGDSGFGYCNSSGYNCSSGSSGNGGSSGASPGCWAVNYGLCFSGDTGPNGQPFGTDPGFACKIALSNGQPGSGGFVTLPGGTFALDPKSDVSIAPHGSNFGYSFEDGRWYPVRSPWVTPDGSRYAYMDPTGIHVVTTASAADTLLGKDQVWQLLAVDAGGAYVVQQNRTIGLWYETWDGTVRQVTDKGVWIVFGAGVAYGLTAQSVPAGVANPVLRVDLATGVVKTWWSQPPPQVQLLTTTPDGSLLLQVLPQSFQVVDVRKLSTADQWIPVFSEGDPGRWVQSPVIVDARGAWLSDGRFIWLAAPNGVFLVSMVAGQLASGCIP